MPRMNVHVPFAAAMMCGRGRSSGRDMVVVVATMARCCGGVGRHRRPCRGLLCDTRFTVGDLARAHALLQVPFLAAMLCVVVVLTAVALVVVVTTTTRVGSGGGCRSPSSIIGIPAICHGHLATGTRAFARREVWVPVRSSQSPGTSKCQLGNWRFVSLA